MTATNTTANTTATTTAETAAEKVDTGHFRILERPITADELIPHVLTDAYGAVATFSGTVRNHARGKSVTGLTYEAYPEMAEAEMRKIALEVYARWPDCRVAMLHRIGKLEIGEVSVAIAVATPHRKESFAACAFAIDRLKETVPIWKKEAYADGEVWVEGVSPGAGASPSP